MHPTRTILGASLALAFGAAPLAAIVDRNNDGLSDVWAALYHPTKGAGVDEDGDGFTNAQEALAGTDPLNAASRFAAAPPQADAAGNLVLRWRGAWGKRYTVQSSADLKTWTALPGLSIGRGQELNAIVRAAGAAAEAKRYWRVVVADVDTDDDGMTSAEEIELGSDPTTKDATMGTPRVYGAEYFVSPYGSDANSGTKAKPFLTLEKAKAAVRTKNVEGIPAGGIAVWLRGGVYERSATLEFTAADSGTSAANSVDWRAYPGEEARLVGGKRLPASGFSVVTSASPVWNRLDATARGKVLQLDLKPSFGITAESKPEEKAAAYGVLRQRSFGKELVSALELFVDGKPMWLGRWPDRTEDSPPQSITGDSFTIYGSPTPGIAGRYSKIGTLDGVSNFKRDGLVDGKQFYLHRYYWINAAGGDRGWHWVVTTSPAGQDGAEPMWMSFGTAEPTIFYPTSELAKGWLFSRDPARQDHGFVYSTTESTGSFGFAGQRPERWTTAPDLWVDGFWRKEFDEYHFPATVDVPGRRIVLPVRDAGGDAIGVMPFHPWYAYNLLEEISEPGEWYLDRASGLLYLWPPEGFGPDSEVTVSMLEDSIVKFTGASFIGLRDLTMELSRINLVTANSGQGIELVRLHLRNSGGSAAKLLECTGTALRRSTIADCGHAAVWVTGGNRKDLVKADNWVEDCEITRYGRFQFSGVHGIILEGCGSTIRNNHIYDAPDRAIGYNGNEHLIEANEINDVCLICADAAAIYTGAWDVRGNKIRDNFIHHVRSAILGNATNGIYVDDDGAGLDAEGNFLYEVAGRAFFFNGGRDNIARRNLIVRCGSGLYVTTRGLGMPEEFDRNGKTPVDHMLARLLAVNYRSALWRTRYPQCALIPNTAAVIAAERDIWLAPRDCRFEDNFGWRSRDGWYAGLDVAKNYFANGSNIETRNVPDTDPLFVDEAAGDLNLRPESPAWTKLGWTTSPVDNAGIRE